MVQITVDGKKKHLGYFTDEEKAGRAFDKYVVDNNLDRPLNFPVAAEEDDERFDDSDLLSDGIPSRSTRSARAPGNTDAARETMLLTGECANVARIVTALQARVEGALTQDVTDDVERVVAALQARSGSVRGAELLR